MSGGFVSTALKPKGWHKTIPTCHPTRKHHGKGKCRSCYHKTYRDKEKEHKRLVAYARGKKLETWALKALIGINCSLCGIDFNPELKKDRQHPELCSECERDILRSATHIVDLTPYHAEVFNRQTAELRIKITKKEQHEDSHR
jgi:hypothetical protein